MPNTSLREAALRQGDTVSSSTKLTVKPVELLCYHANGNAQYPSASSGQAKSVQVPNAQF
ncbi:hypothetical protein [Nostoc sp.]